MNLTDYGSGPVAVKLKTIEGLGQKGKEQREMKN